MSKAKKIEPVFEKKIKLSKDTYEFYFRRPSGLSFKAGQYLKWNLSIKNPDNRGSSRYFTISSSPKNKDFITITTRVIKSSFKKKLLRLKKGDKARAFGPLGYFNFSIDSKKNKIFLAGGIGLTPYHSILTTIKDNKRIPYIFFFVSFPKKEEVIYFDLFKEIEKRNSKIKIIYTLTKENVPGFESGRINKQLIKKYVPQYKKLEFYVVGSEAMEEGMLEMLKEMRIPKKNIFSENFPGY
jgi:ferredoxin-NADP reductase